MENNLVKHENLSITEIQKISEIFVQSGLFQGVDSFAKAFVKVQAGNEFGIKPFAAMSGIHIIGGKPVIGAGVIASRIKASSKYDYKVRELDGKICIIDFFQTGGVLIGTETFTIEDAKRAGTGTAGGKDVIGKYPKNMLFARAISNGVKFYCPDVFDGPVYVAEEMPEQPTVDVQHVDVVPDDIMNLIQICVTKKELNAVYKSNKNAIDASADLKAAAKGRQEDLKSLDVKVETVVEEETPPLLLDPAIQTDWQDAL